MWKLTDRLVKAVSDATVGTMIVLFHIVLADRDSRRLVVRPTPRLPS